MHNHLINCDVDVVTTRYSSVEFGTWPNRRSMSERERAQTPSPGSSRGRHGRENDVDDFKRQSAGPGMMSTHNSVIMAPLLTKTFNAHR